MAAEDMEATEINAESTSTVTEENIEDVWEREDMVVVAIEDMERASAENIDTITKSTGNAKENTEGISK